MAKEILSDYIEYGDEGGLMLVLQIGRKKMGCITAMLNQSRINSNDNVPDLTLALTSNGDLAPRTSK